MFINSKNQHNYTPKHKKCLGNLIPTYKSRRDDNKINQKVPKVLSPASPKPGKMKPFSFN